MILNLRWLGVELLICPTESLTKTLWYSDPRTSPSRSARWRGCEAACWTSDAPRTRTKRDPRLWDARSGRQETVGPPSTAPSRNPQAAPWPASSHSILPSTIVNELNPGCDSCRRSPGASRALWNLILLCVHVSFLRCHSGSCHHGSYWRYPERKPSCACASEDPQGNEVEVDRG
jgi:hypothetical protein